MWEMNKCWRFKRVLTSRPPLMQQQEAPRHPAAFSVFILSPRRRSHPSRRCLLSIKYLAGEGRRAQAAQTVRAYVCADRARTDLVAGPRRRRRPMVA